MFSSAKPLMIFSTIFPHSSRRLLSLNVPGRLTGFCYCPIVRWNHQVDEAAWIT